MHTYTFLKFSADITNSYCQAWDVQKFQHLKDSMWIQKPALFKQKK